MARIWPLCWLGAILAAGPVQAHDPVFGLGPHTLFKGGLEVHAGSMREESGDEREQEFELELKYGITADWAVGIEMPYVDLSEPDGTSSGRGDLTLKTKYRFWRRDALGLQESAALSVGLVPGGTGDDEVGNDDATDAIVGLSYGYEGRRWYRWAAVRYRANGEDEAGVQRGNKLLVDLVGGIRFRPTGYLEPDKVWMLELNAEFANRAERKGRKLTNTGGDRLFVSPGLMWTYRNYAIKTGVQIPVSEDLEGDQHESDYRFTLEFEAHF